MAKKPSELLFGYIAEELSPCLRREFKRSWPSTILVDAQLKEIVEMKGAYQIKFPQKIR